MADKLLAAAETAGKQVVLAGDAAELIFAEMQAKLGERVLLAPPERRCFNACACALLAGERAEQAKPAAEVEAFYLRASEAERNRLAKLSKEAEAGGLV